MADDEYNAIFPDLYERLVEEEGQGKVRVGKKIVDTAVPYLDSKGIPTVGLGHNLKTGVSQPVKDLMAANDGGKLKRNPMKDRWNQDEIDLQAAIDIRKHYEEARRIIPNYDNLSHNRKVAFADMLFNIGATRVKGFPTMLKELGKKDVDWGKVAFNMVGNRKDDKNDPSKRKYWATDYKDDTGNRAKALAAQVAYDKPVRKYQLDAYDKQKRIK